MSKVCLGLQNLSGANGAAKVLESLHPTTVELNLSFNDDFGYTGLKSLVQGMTKWEQPVYGLQRLYLGDSGLGGSTTEVSLYTLSQLLGLTPALEYLDISFNDLRDLPPSFIQAVISHSKLNTLSLYGNDKLGCAHHPSTPCAINLFLSQYHSAALSSSCPLALRDLRLRCTGMSAKCCGPLLKKVLSLGSKGLQRLHLEHNASLLPLARTLARTISTDNFYIQSFAFDELYELEWEDEDSTFIGKAADILGSALSRNRRLEKETRQAASQVLFVAQVVFLGSSGPSTGSPADDERSERTKLLDLPFELLQMVLSFIDPGALSDRQIASIIRHAADRTTLVPSRFDRYGFCQRLCDERTRFLKRTGCDGYDR